MSTYAIQCPDCHAAQIAKHPGGFTPILVECTVCGRQFILEPEASGAKTYRNGEAPCCSDPDCRATEMGDSGND